MRKSIGNEENSSDPKASQENVEQFPATKETETPVTINIATQPVLSESNPIETQVNLPIASKEIPISIRRTIPTQKSSNKPGSKDGAKKQDTGVKSNLTPKESSSEKNEEQLKKDMTPSRKPLIKNAEPL